MVYSQSWGKGAQPALLLHCSLASSDAWRGVAGYLADDLTMLAIDFPGHGASADWDGVSDYHTLCRDAAAAAMGGPMHLIGHSFGGTVALRLAVEQPEMVRSLTLIEPVFFAAAQGTDGFAQHQAEFDPFVSALARGDRENAARVFTDIWGTGASWDALPAAMRGYIIQRIDLIPAAVPAIYDDTAGLLQGGRLERVECPVLLMQGGQSPAVIAAINDALALRLPNVRRVVVSWVGHMLPVTHAAQVARAISGFLGLS